MSLINDALKQARQTPPGNTPDLPPPPFHPVTKESSSAIAWIIPAVVIVLVVAAVFFIGWAAAHHFIHNVAATPTPAKVVEVTKVIRTTQTVEVAASPALVAAQSQTPEPVSLSLAPQHAPKLQGIFYSPTAPAAIVNGKTVHPGDRVGQYQVKAISRYTVTLVGSDKKEIQIGMGN